MDYFHRHIVEQKKSGTQKTHILNDSIYITSKEAKINSGVRSYERGEESGLSGEIREPRGGLEISTLI